MCVCVALLGLQYTYWQAKIITGNDLLILHSRMGP